MSSRVTAVLSATSDQAAQSSSAEGADEVVRHERIQIVLRKADKAIGTLVGQAQALGVDVTAQVAVGFADRNSRSAP